MTSSAGKKLARSNVLFLLPANIIAYPLKLIYNQNPAKEKSIEDREKAVLTFILSNSNMRSKDKKPSEINLRT